MRNDPTRYQLIDFGDQQKLEMIGGMKFIRPAAAATGSRAQPKLWTDIDGRFDRDRKGKGRWNWSSAPPDPWIGHHAGHPWSLRANEHGHIGIFPEQQENWDWLSKQIDGDPIDVLNLFAYTGGSTLAAAAAGATVCHLDASRSSVKCARENANASDLGEAPVRWIIDDAMEFLKRELRREKRYQGIIIDPPTYGRGPSRQVWDIDKDMIKMLDLCRDLFAGDGRFLLLSAHTPGYTPDVLARLVEDRCGFRCKRGEMQLETQDGRLLSSGSFARWSRR
ncbi:MAG: class I SAM-dependent methyltransferase [Planctomycetota bacterium]|nr:class I SAM-dependent methyltransferase [Planctomycetota bacterium]